MILKLEMITASICTLMSYTVVDFLIVVGCVNVPISSELSPFWFGIK